MDDARATFLGSAHLFAQTGKVRGKNRRCQLNQRQSLRTLLDPGNRSRKLLAVYHPKRDGYSDFSPPQDRPQAAHVPQNIPHHVTLVGHVRRAPIHHRRLRHGRSLGLGHQRFSRRLRHPPRQRLPVHRRREPGRPARRGHAGCRHSCSVPLRTQRGLGAGRRHLRRRGPGHLLSRTFFGTEWD